MFFLLPTLFLISCHVTSGSYTFLSIGDWGANTIPDRGSMSYQKNVGAVASQLTKSYRNADAKFVLNLVRTSNSIATKSFKQTKIRFQHSLLTHVDELLSFFFTPGDRSNASKHSNNRRTWQGDSFYWCGIQNTSDFQVETDFAPYKDIKVDWYVVRSTEIRALGKTHFASQVRSLGKSRIWIQCICGRRSVQHNRKFVSLSLSSLSLCFSDSLSNQI